MTRGLDPKLSQGAPSGLSAASSIVALSEDEVASSVHALNAKLFDTITKHCTLQKTIRSWSPQSSTSSPVQ